MDFILLQEPSFLSSYLSPEDPRMVDTRTDAHADNIKARYRSPEERLDEQLGNMRNRLSMSFLNTPTPEKLHPVHEDEEFDESELDHEEPAYHMTPDGQDPVPVAPSTSHNGKQMASVLPMHRLHRAQIRNTPLRKAMESVNFVQRQMDGLRNESDVPVPRARAERRHETLLRNHFPQEKHAYLLNGFVHYSSSPVPKKALSFANTSSATSQKFPHQHINDDEISIQNKSGRSGTFIASDQSYRSSPYKNANNSRSFSAPPKTNSFDQSPPLIRRLFGSSTSSSSDPSLHFQDGYDAKLLEERPVGDTTSSPRSVGLLKIGAFSSTPSTKVSIHASPASEDPTSATRSSTSKPPAFSNPTALLNTPQSTSHTPVQTINRRRTSLLTAQRSSSILSYSASAHRSRLMEAYARDKYASFPTDWSSPPMDELKGTTSNFCSSEHYESNSIQGSVHDDDIGCFEEDFSSKRVEKFAQTSPPMESQLNQSTVSVVLPPELGRLFLGTAGTPGSATRRNVRMKRLELGSKNVSLNYSYTVDVTTCSLEADANHASLLPQAPSDTNNCADFATATDQHAHGTNDDCNIAANELSEFLEKYSPAKFRKHDDHSVKIVEAVTQTVVAVNNAHAPRPHERAQHIKEVDLDSSTTSEDSLSIENVLKLVRERKKTTSTPLGVEVSASASNPAPFTPAPAARTQNTTVPQTPYEKLLAYRSEKSCENRGIISGIDENMHNISVATDTLLHSPDAYFSALYERRVNRDRSMTQRRSSPISREYDHENNVQGKNMEQYAEPVTATFPSIQPKALFTTPVPSHEDVDKLISKYSARMEKLDARLTATNAFPTPVKSLSFSTPQTAVRELNLQDSAVEALCTPLVDYNEDVPRSKLEAPSALPRELLNSSISSRMNSSARVEYNPLRYSAKNNSAEVHEKHEIESNGANFQSTIMSEYENDLSFNMEDIENIDHIGQEDMELEVTMRDEVHIHSIMTDSAPQSQEIATTELHDSPLPSTSLSFQLPEEHRTLVLQRQTLLQHAVQRPSAVAPPQAMKSLHSLFSKHKLQKDDALAPAPIAALITASDVLLTVTAAPVPPELPIALPIDGDMGEMPISPVLGAQDRSVSGEPHAEWNLNPIPPSTSHSSSSLSSSSSPCAQDTPPLPDASTYHWLLRAHRLSAPGSSFAASSASFSPLSPRGSSEDAAALDDDNTISGTSPYRHQGIHTGLNASVTADAPIALPVTPPKSSKLQWMGGDPVISSPCVKKSLSFRSADSSSNESSRENSSALCLQNQSWQHSSETTENSIRKIEGQLDDASEVMVVKSSWISDLKKLALEPFSSFTEPEDNVCTPPIALNDVTISQCFGASTSFSEPQPRDPLSIAQKFTFTP